MPTASLDARYGRNRRNPRRTRLLIAVLAAVFLATVAYVGVRFADQPAQTQGISYRHIDDGHLAFTFQVTRRPGTAVRCTVEAFDDRRGQVGFATVDIPAGDSAQVRRTVTIATQGKAVSADIQGCSRA